MFYILVRVREQDRPYILWWNDLDDFFIIDHCSKRHLAKISETVSLKRYKTRRY